MPILLITSHLFAAQAKEHGARDDPKTRGLYRDEITDILESEGLEFSNSEMQTFFAYFDVCDDSTIVSWYIFSLLICKVGLVRG
jgi:hypothetical protein